MPIHIRVGVNSGEVVVRSIGGDLKMDYTAVRRDCPRRLMSSSAGVADALEDLSGRGASGRPVSFTTVSPGSRACSVRGPSDTFRQRGARDDNPLFAPRRYVPLRPACLLGEKCSGYPATNRGATGGRTA